MSLRRAEWRTLELLPGPVDCVAYESLIENTEAEIRLLRPENVVRS